MARDVLTDPVKIVQGNIGVASENVTQHVKVGKLYNQGGGMLSFDLVKNDKNVVLPLDLPLSNFFPI